MWKLSGLGLPRWGTNSGVAHRDRFDDGKQKQHCQFSWGKKCFFSLKAGDVGGLFALCGAASCVYQE